VLIVDRWLAIIMVTCLNDFLFRSLILHDVTLPPGSRRNCVLLCYYTACFGNLLPKFRSNLSVPYSRVVAKLREEITTIT